jgi:hypothetical protein
MTDNQTANNSGGKVSGVEYAIRQRGRLIDLGASPDMAYQIVGTAGPGLVNASLSLARTLVDWLAEEGKDPDIHAVRFAEMILTGALVMDPAIVRQTWVEIFGWEPRVVRERFPALIKGALKVLHSGIIKVTATQAAIPTISHPPNLALLPPLYPSMPESSGLVEALLDWLTDDTGEPDIHAFRFAEMVLYGVQEMEPLIVNPTWSEVLEWQPKLFSQSQLKALVESALEMLRNKRIALLGE